MTTPIFLILFALFSLTLLIWGFRYLPRRNWQFFLVLPGKQASDGSWSGRNLTYYGLFNAIAYTLAVSLGLFLMSTIQLPLSCAALMVTIMLIICMPASRLVAWIVEKNPYRFTVGGAAFTGIIALPIVLFGLNRWLYLSAPLPILTICAALALAYAYGEGVGRLACLSFGCCYGQPMDELNPLLQKMFAPFAITYEGTCKKAIYAGNHQNRPLLPIQAITATLYTVTALLGTGLFLHGYFRSAFVLAIVMTQGWRFLSEFLRSDERGAGWLSAYQWMALIAMIYATTIAFVNPPESSQIVLSDGLAVFAKPAVLLSLQGLAFTVLFYTGLSSVTAVNGHFSVKTDRI